MGLGGLDRLEQQPILLRWIWIWFQLHPADWFPERRVGISASTKQWIWWKGSTDVDQPGTYITSPYNFFQLNYVNNAIGGRRGTAHWAPDFLGYVYMFGGQGYDNTPGGPFGSMNDLWRYLAFPN